MLVILFQDPTQSPNLELVLLIHPALSIHYTCPTFPKDQDLQEAGSRGGDGVGLGSLQLSLTTTRWSSDDVKVKCLLGRHKELKNSLKQSLVSW